MAQAYWENQVTLVTGGTRGLGAAVSTRLAGLGAKVAVNYLHNHSTAQNTVKEITENGGEALAIAGDITEETSVKRVFNQVEEAWGPVTIVVNNALPAFQFDPVHRPDFEEMTWDAFTEQWNGSVRAAYLTCQRAASAMKSAGHGRVINIVSDLIFRPSVPYHDYIAAKSALMSLTRTLASQWGPYGITVNAVAPGLIYPTHSSRATPRTVREDIKRMTPLGRIVTPEDVAGAVAFFASEEAAMITGQCLTVDGGLVMR